MSLETAANKQDHGYRQEYENGLGRLKLRNVKLDIVEQDRTSFGCICLGLAWRCSASMRMVIQIRPRPRPSLATAKDFFGGFVPVDHAKELLRHLSGAHIAVTWHECITTVSCSFFPSAVLNPRKGEVHRTLLLSKPCRSTRSQGCSKHQLTLLILVQRLTLPPRISSRDGMMLRRISSDAFATIGSRCMVATAVTFPSFAWYVANWCQQPKSIVLPLSRSYSL